MVLFCQSHSHKPYRKQLNELLHRGIRNEPETNHRISTRCLQTKGKAMIKFKLLYHCMQPMIWSGMRSSRSIISNNVKSLVDELNYFYKQTKNEIRFEYIFFNAFNDSLKDADEHNVFYHCHLSLNFSIYEKFLTFG